MNINCLIYVYCCKPIFRLIQIQPRETRYLFFTEMVFVSVGISPDRMKIKICQRAEKLLIGDNKARVESQALKNNHPRDSVLEKYFVYLNYHEWLNWAPGRTSSIVKPCLESL